MRMLKNVLFAAVLACTMTGCGKSSDAPLSPGDAGAVDVSEAVKVLESNPTEREQKLLAIRMLERMGPNAKEAIPAIEKYRDDPDEEVRKAVKESLEKIQK